MSSINLKSYETKISRSKFYQAYNYENKGNTQRKSNDNIYIKTVAKRISDYDRVSKYQHVKDFVSNKVSFSWEEGNVLIKNSY